MEAIKNTSPDKQELRKFGFIMAGFLIVVFGLLLPWLFNVETLPRWPYIVAALFFFPALVYPLSLGYPYKAWMLFGSIMGWVNSRVILTVLFFLVFLPFGFVMRLLGHDPMFRRLDPKAESYRVISKRRDRNHFERPF